MDTRIFLFLFSTFVMFAPAYAAIVVTLEEQGSDVVASYSGSIDLDGISFSFGTNANQNITPSSAQIAFIKEGDQNKGSNVAFGGNPWSVAPTAFGSGELATADTFSIENGNSFGFNPVVFYVADNYTSGSDISGSMTFSDQTFDDLGIDVGTMNATFGSGDTLTLTAVPEPNSYGFLLGAAGLATAIFFRRRRRSSAV